MTVNVGTVTGGTVANVVPDHATARLDLRAWTATDMAALLDACRATVDGHHVADIRFRFTDDEYSVMPALERTPAVAQLEATAQAIATALGFHVDGAATGGASDASWVAARARRSSTVWVPSAAWITARTSTSNWTASSRARRCWRGCCWPCRVEQNLSTSEHAQSRMWDQTRPDLVRLWYTTLYERYTHTGSMKRCR
ncbi:MAG: peptidase dimerization domain-containing protein [Caldilineaceae bacterium]